MKAILRLLPAQLRRFARLYLSLAVIAALGIGCLVGLVGGYRAVKAELDAYLTEYENPDITFTLAETDALTFPLQRIRQLPGVQKASVRYAMDIGAETAQGELLSVRLFSLTAADFCKTRVLRSAGASGKLPNVSVSSEFAEHSGLAPGDTLTLVGYGARQSVYIQSTVTNPQCISVKPDRYVWAETADFGYLYLQRGEALTLGIADKANQLLVRLADGADADAVIRQVGELLPDTLLSAEKYTDSAVAQNIQDNLDPLRSLSVRVPVLFFGVTALMTVLFSARIVTKSRRQMGILTMLGYAGGDICLLFAAAALVTGLCALVLGGALGMGLCCYATYSYGQNFGLVYHIPTLPFGLLCGAGAVSIALFCGTTALTVRRALRRLTPVQALNASGEAAARGFVRRGPLGFKLFLQRFVRHYKRNLAAVVCMAAAMLPVFCGVSFYSAKQGVMNDYFTKRTRYDAAVYLNTDSVDQAAALPLPQTVTQSTVALQASVQLTGPDGRQETVLLQGIQPGQQTVQLLDENRRVTALPADGLLLEKHTAQKLGVRVGDTVTLDGTPVRVAGLSDQSVYRISYLTLSALQQLPVKSKTAVVFCCTGDRQALTAALQNEESFVTVLFTDSLKAAALRASRVTDVGIYLVIAAAVVLGFVTAVQLKQMTLDDEAAAIAIKRTVGYRFGSIGADLLAEDALRLALAAGLALPLGSRVAKAVLQSMTTATRAYPYCQSPLAPLVAVGSTVLFLLATHALLMRRVRGMNLAAAMKSRE